jgi:hypothetical protein
MALWPPSITSDYKPFFAIRKRHAAQRLHHSLELPRFEGRNRLRSFRICVEQLDPTQ